MTVNTKFEAYKLERELKRSGSDLVFKRAATNEYGEPVSGGDPVEVATIRCLYHETNSYITTSNHDGETTRTKKQPMLLCLCNDLVDSGIEFGDLVEIPMRGPQTSSKTLQYVGMVDIQSWGIVADLSFQEVDNGT